MQLFTIGLTAWTGFIYVVMFALRFSHHMLHHQDLELVIFGPAVILLVLFAAYQLHIHRRH